MKRTPGITLAAFAIRQCFRVADVEYVIKVLYPFSLTGHASTSHCPAELVMSKRKSVLTDYHTFRE